MPNYFASLISGGHFDLSSMVARVDKVPFVPGQAQRFFAEVPVDTTTVQLEERSQTLALVQTSQRGATGDTKIDDLRKVRAFPVFHLQRNDALYADEVQNVREFGSTNVLQTVESKLARKMALHQADIDATIEKHCMTALQGLSKDADGSTMLDIAASMGVSLPSEVNYDFDITTNDPQKITSSIIRGAEDRLGALKPARFHALCSPGFMDELTTHDDIKAAYSRALAGMEAAASAAGVGDWMRQRLVRMAPFYFAGVWWEEYRGGSQYIADDKAIIFPVFDGVAAETVYPLYYGPADYFDTVNTMGRPRYARMKMSPDPDRLAPFELQTNPLAMNTRPDAATMVRKT
jgi:Phage major capsid protein E